jgi:hypothetical protein
VPTAVIRPAISMRKLVLPESGSRRGQTNFPLDRNSKLAALNLRLYEN